MIGQVSIAPGVGTRNYVKTSPGVLGWGGVWHHGHEIDRCIINLIVYFSVEHHAVVKVEWKEPASICIAALSVWP